MMNPEEWTVESANEYLNNIPKFSKEKHSAGDLRSMLLYLDAMPDKERIIHVAGTNGKGSVCAFLDSILSKNGNHTARFTSPHLVRVTERFSFDGKEVDDELFIESFLAVRNAYKNFEKDGLGHPTYFEYLFLMFMWMVRHKETEYVILETGLGGRLDATNCIENPALTIITSISLDHMEYLGDTVIKIAGEKAGILKKGVPVIYDDTDKEASEVIRKKAEEFASFAYPVNTLSYTGLRHVDGGMSFNIKEEKIFIPFEAEYQAVNASIAYEAVRILGISSDVAVRGIKDAVWRGRMEEIADGVYLDGAHNEGGIRAFVNAACELSKVKKGKSGKGGRVSLLFAAVSDKNYESMLETLIRKLRPDHLILTHLSTSRALPTPQMESAANKIADEMAIECHIESIPDLNNAYRTLIKEKKPEDICFCVGSLYLVGELEDYILS